MRKTGLFAMAMVAMACSEAPTAPARDLDVSAVVNANHPTVQAVETIYAVTSGNQLISFQSGSSTASTSVTISGLGGETALGIDFRPSDIRHIGFPRNNIGVLYVLTSGSRVCVVDPATGAASRCVRLVTSTGTLVNVSGTSFGIGFNPVPDRLRVHSDTDQNLRINVDDGVTIVDGPLAYTAGDRNAGANPEVIGTCYTNNDADPATGTELYGIDVGLDVLVEFGPASAVGVVPATGPNSGQLVTVGPLGVNTVQAGCDISNATQIAYASLNIHQGSAFVPGPGLFTVDLDTGASVRIGGLPSTAQPIVSIAVSPASTGPAPVVTGTTTGHRR